MNVLECTGSVNCDVGDYSLQSKPCVLAQLVAEHL